MKSLSYIKYAQRFELIGEVLCLGGSLAFMYDAIHHYDLGPYLIGSILYGCGSSFMLIQSILTLYIPEQN